MEGGREKEGRHLSQTTFSGEGRSNITASMKETHEPQNEALQPSNLRSIGNIYKPRMYIQERGTGGLRHLGMTKVPETA